MLFMVFQFISIVWCSMDRSTQLTLAVFCGFGIWMGLGWYIIFLRFLVLILSYLLEFSSSLTLEIQKHLGTYIRCFATKQCTQRKKHPMLWTSGRSWRPFPFPKCGGTINKFSSPWVTRPPSFNRTPLEQRGAHPEVSYSILPMWVRTPFLLSTRDAHLSCQKTKDPTASLVKLHSKIGCFWWFLHENFRVTKIPLVYERMQIYPDYKALEGFSPQTSNHDTYTPSN